LELASRYADQLLSSLRCFDRVIVHGTLVDVAHPGALLVSMKAAGFRPRDLARYAQPMRQEIQDAAVTLAREHGLEIEKVTRKDFRQEDRNGRQRPCPVRRLGPCAAVGRRTEAQGSARLV
jgi:hypothetical protein